MACSIVAVLLHYLYLLAFMWMLLEGVIVYLVLVKVFVDVSKRKYFLFFTGLGYGNNRVQHPNHTLSTLAYLPTILHG